LHSDKSDWMICRSNTSKMAPGNFRFMTSYLIAFDQRHCSLHCVTYNYYGGEERTNTRGTIRSHTQWTHLYDICMSTMYIMNATRISDTLHNKHQCAKVSTAVFSNTTNVGKIVVHGDPTHPSLFAFNVYGLCTCNKNNKHD